jgi:hypothetical protein
MGCTPEDDLDLISFSLQLSWGSVNSSPAQYTTGANKRVGITKRLVVMAYITPVPPIEQRYG